MGPEILLNIKESIDFIKSKTQLRPRIGITLGSGLSSFADTIDVDCKIPYSEIPHFIPPTVEGHPGSMVFGKVNEIPIVIMQGRVHYYEGHSMDEVVYPTRVMAQVGIEKLILTNAAGGLDPSMKPGDLMVITDHINLTGKNPLIGPNIAELGLRFPDMTEAWDKEMSEIALGILQELKISHTSGVYCGVSGPTYETAAEVQYLHKIGGGAVGMSTVPENIAAKHMGLRVAGVSCISNLGTGLSSSPITHDEVKEVAAMVEKSFAAFLLKFVEKIG